MPLEAGSSAVSSRVRWILSENLTSRGLASSRAETAELIFLRGSLRNTFSSGGGYAPVIILIKDKLSYGKSDLNSALLEFT